MRWIPVADASIKGAYNPLDYGRTTPWFGHNANHSYHFYLFKAPMSGNQSLTAPDRDEIDDYVLASGKYRCIIHVADLWRQNGKVRRIIRQGTLFQDLNRPIIRRHGAYVCVVSEMTKNDHMVVRLSRP